MQVVQPEAMRFDTEAIRRHIEVYKETPSADARRRMEGAFGAFDARVKGLEVLAQTQTGLERTSTEQQVADLKRRRDLQWTRAQTVVAETQMIKRAEPVAERVTKGERVNNPQRVRRAERPRMMEPRRTSQAAARSGPESFFQRLFR